MKVQAALATALSILLAGCSHKEIAGSWGEDSADCKANPHTISFSKQADLMYVRYPNGGSADGKSLQDLFTYRVLARNRSGLKVALIGESRKDIKGQTVTWEIRHPEDGSYCWRRSDWHLKECTAARIRCGL